MFSRSLCARGIGQIFVSRQYHRRAAANGAGAEQGRKRWNDNCDMSGNRAHGATPGRCVRARFRAPVQQKLYGPHGVSSHMTSNVRGNRRAATEARMSVELVLKGTPRLAFEQVVARTSASPEVHPGFKASNTTGAEGMPKNGSGKSDRA